MICQSLGNSEITEARCRKAQAELPPHMCEECEHKGKRCTKCKEVKPLKAFAPDKRTPDGLRHWCKKCMAENQRKAYAKRRAAAAQTPRIVTEKLTKKTQGKDVNAILEKLRAERSDLIRRTEHLTITIKTIEELRG